MHTKAASDVTMLLREMRDPRQYGVALEVGKGSVLCWGVVEKLET
jgi:dTDP-glucose pyrophosphorylase